MSLRTVALLLVTWCGLVVAPSLIVLSVFTGADADSAITGPIFAIWIVGYLLQLGVFMAVARKSKGNSILGWLLASLLPWAADWSAPVARWGPFVCAVIVVTYACWFYSRLARSENLQRNGIPATGTVLEVNQPMMNTVINNVYIRRTMRMRVQRSDGVPPYEANYSGTFMLGEIPSPGTVFHLRVDPKNPKHFETVDDELAASYSPPTASTFVDYPPATPPASGPAVGDQLQKLAQMHSRGDLTDDEFAAAKRRILNG